MNEYMIVMLSYSFVCASSDQRNDSLRRRVPVLYLDEMDRNAAKVKKKRKKTRPQIQWKVTWEEEVKRRGIWSTNKWNRLIFKWPFVLPHFRLCRIEQSIETELADKAAILARIFMTPTELTDFQWPIYFPSPSLGSFDVFILSRTLFCSLGRVVNSNIKARGCR